MTTVPSLFDDEHLTESNHPGGAPPLDWWVIATTKDEAYRRVIAAMCPTRVCRQCGEPSRRIVGEAEYTNPRTGKPANLKPKEWSQWPLGWHVNQSGPSGSDQSAIRVTKTLGFSDCGHDDYRPGVWIDPFNPEPS